MEKYQKLNWLFIIENQSSKTCTWGFLNIGSVTLWLEKMYKQKMYKISTKKHITQD